MVSVKSQTQCTNDSWLRKVGKASRQRVRHSTLHLAGMGGCRRTMWEKGLKGRMGHTKSVEVRLHADVGSTLTQKGPESVLTVGGYRGVE